jgi:hypothetical protein
MKMMRKCNNKSINLTINRIKKMELILEQLENMEIKMRKKK